MKLTTDSHEHRLWDELNSLLTDTMPDGASEKEAEDFIVFAVMGRDAEIAALYKRVREVARRKDGYLRRSMAEDNRVARAQRRLYGRWA